MKRIVIFILILTVYICGVKAQNDAMFVYRNDEQINAFLKAEIDSIKFSHIGLDSLEYRDFVVQEVWTADSIYRIPLAAIDSVSFVTPPTVCKSDVTRIDDILLDYIIGCDSLTLKLKSVTPVEIIPHRGDKLVLLDGCEVLPYGFSGIVSEVYTVSDGIDVVCEQAYLEDLFDSFCSVSTMYGTGGTAPTYVAASGHPERVVYDPGSKEFNLGPYNYDVTSEISNGITPDGDLALKEGASISLSINPTFRVHTFLMMCEGQGTYFSCSITGDIDVESKLAIYAGVEYSHDLEMGEFEFPIPATYGLVKFYIVPGFFGRMGATITASVTERRTYTLGMAYDYSSIGVNVLAPALRCRLSSSSKEIEGSIDGSIAAGAFIETGLNILSRDLTKVYVRGEYGWQLNGSFVLRNSDIKEAEKDTKLYERLKASSIETGPFANVSMGGSVLNSGPSVTLGESKESVKKWDIVPSFSDTQIRRSFISTSADVSVGLSGECLFPETIGFKLFDENKCEVANFSYPDKYSNKGGYINQSFSGVDRDKKYTVYPKVNLFGFDILASPLAELDSVGEDESFLTCPDDHHPHAIDLGLPSGTLWSCCNAGASKPEEYGGYYSFNETTSAPSREQIEELIECTSQHYHSLNGVKGILFRGFNGGEIFLPSAGGETRGSHDASYYFEGLHNDYVVHDCSNNVQGKNGLYWSSTEIIRPNGYYPDRVSAYFLYFNNNDPGSVKCTYNSVGCYYNLSGQHYCNFRSLRQVR